MAYRILYGRKRRYDLALALLAGVAALVWMGLAGYEDLARYVGAAIRGAH